MAGHDRDREPWVRVNVVCGETVTERGTQKTTWFRREASRWVRLTAEQTDSTQEHLAPGTIWQTSIEATLKPGSWLLCVDSLPSVERRLDPLEYLRRESLHTTRRTLKRYYRVQSDGRLIEGQPTRAELDGK